VKLIIFSGLPGAGKSALAEAVGQKLGVPVFAKDWLEATLLRCELAPANPEKPLGSAGYQLLTMLAERQLQLGQSVILDSVASTLTIRTTWRALAEKYAAEWRVIECLCSDEALHRARLSTRQRQIPGWHELEWSEVEHVKSYFAVWDEPHLILDTINPFDQILAHALAYCA
jgi:predicted kinase